MARLRRVVRRPEAGDGRRRAAGRVRDRRAAGDRGARRLAALHDAAEREGADAQPADGGPGRHVRGARRRPGERGHRELPSRQHGPRPARRRGPWRSRTRASCRTATKGPTRSSTTRWACMPWPSRRRPRWCRRRSSSTCCRCSRRCSSWAWSAARSRRSRWIATGPTPRRRSNLVLLEAGCVTALSLALFSGHFSVWPRYFVNGRQVAGLCHLVPVLACLAALLPPVTASGGTARRVMPGSALVVAGLIASGALAAALNPVLVPLQAVLCAVALAGRGAPAAGDMVRHGAGSCHRWRTRPRGGRERPLPVATREPARPASAASAVSRHGAGRLRARLHGPQLPDGRVHRPRPRVPGRARRGPRAVAGPHAGGGRAPVHAAGAAPLRPARARPASVPRPDRRGPRARARFAPRRTCSRSCPGCSSPRRSPRAIAGCSPPPAASRRRSPSTRASAACSGRWSIRPIPGCACSRTTPTPPRRCCSRRCCGRCCWSGPRSPALLSTRGGAAGCASPRRPRSSCRWRRAPPDRSARGMAWSRILDGPSAADLDALASARSARRSGRRRLPRRGPAARIGR